MKKLLTFYSPSHRVLFEDYFLPSFEKYLTNEYELVVREFEQVSPTGEFASQGFDKAMLEKLDFIIETIANLSEYEEFVFSDCDVQFFASLSYELGEHDILFQQDYYEGNVCAGFFIARVNPCVRDFFAHARDILANRLNTNTEDQTVINGLLHTPAPMVRAGMLPKEQYWTVGNVTRGALWNGEDVEIPEGIIMHHANFTIGIEKKIALLDLVKKKHALL